MECVQLAAAFAPASSLAGFSRRRSARPLRHRERSFEVRAACCRFCPSQLAGWDSCLQGRNANTNRGGGGDSRKRACGKKLPQASLRKEKRQQAARTPKLRSAGNDGASSGWCGWGPLLSCARVNGPCGGRRMIITRNVLQQRGRSPAHPKAGEKSALGGVASLMPGWLSIRRGRAWPMGKNVEAPALSFSSARADLKFGATTPG